MLADWALGQMLCFYRLIPYKPSSAPRSNLLQMPLRNACTRIPLSCLQSFYISLMFLFPLLRTAAYSAFELFALISCCSFKATIGFFLEALEIRVIHLFLIKEIHYPAILLRS
jgi:hypothetical protein